MAETDVPADLRREFWTQVVIFNVAVLTLAVGLLLVAFEGRWIEGVVLLAVGAAVSLHGYGRYRSATDGRNG